MIKLSTINYGCAVYLKNILYICKVGNFSVKTLEVASLNSAIDSLLEKLASQENDITQIDSAVKGIVELEDSLKGEGGQAIRSFYQDCHLPFLTVYQSVLDEYKSTLTNMKNALQSFEASDNGFIRESFLQNDLTDALQKAKRVTIDLTNEANGIMRNVQDIVSLSSLQEDHFIEQVNVADKKIDRTIEQLHEFDRQQTSKLNDVSDSLQIVSDYVKQIESMFRSKEISISGYESGLLLKKLTNGNITTTDSVTGAGFSSVTNGISTRDRAVMLLTEYENNKNLNSIEKTIEDKESLDLLLAIKDGAVGAFTPLAIMATAQKTGLLRIEYTKKKNHYTFKYDKKILKYLKGKIGPDYTRKLIQKINGKSKSNAYIEKTLKAQKKNIASAKNFKDTRTNAQKLEGKIVKMATGNKPLHETVKSKVFKYSARDMVIDKKHFKKIAAKTSGVGAVLVGSYSTVSNIANRWDEGNKQVGQGKYEIRGRVVGEEVNKLVGNVTGAAAGAYIGAAIGGVLSGPFAPFGAAAGAVIGSAIGSSVGEWASKYTNKWMSDAGAATGKVIHDVKEKAKNVWEGAKESLDEAKDKLFGWI